MPISGLVITLAQSKAPADEARRAIEADHRFELGDSDRGRFAAVLETQSREENTRAWDWVSALPGVDFVDLVYVHLDDPGRAQAEGEA